MRKFGLLVLFQLIFIGVGISSPAYPDLIKFIQPDGKEIIIKLYGDEHIKWAETVDGYTLLFNSSGYYEYAAIDEKGDLIPSGIVANDISERNENELSFLRGIEKSLFFSKSQVQNLKQIKEIYQKEAQNAKAFPTTGERKLVCILIGYQDLSFTKTQAEFDALFNQVGYNIGGATGSVKDYFLEASYNQFNLTVDVAGPYTASGNMADYGANSGGNDVNPDGLVTEAVNLADPDVNYADYDNDGDGLVDGVYVIYAGYGEEAGGSANAIWAHASNITLQNLDGVYISKYSCSAELRSNSGSNITRIGVICHEFGHVLGAPDFYDTDYSTGGQYDGTGSWDLQAGGSWNNGGATPPHPNPYTKCYIYNWATATTLNLGQVLTINNSTQNSNEFYRYNTTTSNEFYLLENRQQVGFDAATPGHGLMIYHVDGDYCISHDGTNDINATSHQGMFPMSAVSTNSDGVELSSANKINVSDCPWPGTGGATEFTDVTTPSAQSWASANTSQSLTNIAENSGVITLCYKTCDPPCSEPSTQASNFVSSNFNTSSLTVGWTRGNGDNVLVLANEGEPVNADPTNGVSYGANAAFGLGDEIETGNFVVYNGTGSSVDLTGLTTGTTYYFAIYEYNTASNCYNLIELTGNATTTGTTPPVYCESTGWTVNNFGITLVSFEAINNATGIGTGYDDYTGGTPATVTQSASYNLTVNGNSFSTSYNSDILAWIDWNQNGDFTDPGEEYDLGTASGTNVQSSGSPKNIVVPADAVPGRTRMRVIAMYPSDPIPCQPETFNGEVEDYSVDIVASCTVPSSQASNLSLTPGVNSIDLSWTDGNGDNVLVLAKEGNAVDVDPVIGTGYTGNSNFTLATDIGSGNKVVYAGTGTSVTVNSLTGGTTYYFAVYEFNSSGNCYNLEETTGYSTTLLGPPTADFSADATTIVTGGTINFTDLSINQPTAWTWTFEGGTPASSSAQNPSVVYNTAGTYNVTLYSENSLGNDTELKTNYITVSAATIQFATATSSTSENTSATSGCRGYTDIDITIQIDGSPSADEDVTVLVTGGTGYAPADAEIITAMPIVCSGGSSADKTVTVRIYDDAAIESAETIVLTLSLAGNSDASVGTQSTHTISISDNDSEPVATVNTTIWSEDWDGSISGWYTQQDPNAGTAEYNVNFWTITSSCSGAISSNTAQIVNRQRSGSTWGSYCGYGKGGIYTGLTGHTIYKQVDATGITDINISFDYIVTATDNTEDYGQLVYSIDGGTSWIVVATYTNQTATASVTDLALPASLNGQTFLLGWRWINDTDNSYDGTYSFSIDNIVVKGTAIGVGVTQAYNYSATEYLGPESTVYFYDDTDGNLLAKIENTSTHDFGCTSIQIDRSIASAGSEVVEFWNSGIGNALIAKSLLVTPATNNSSAGYNIRLYFTESEVSGWETATSLSRNDPDLTISKTGGNISNITPTTPDANGNTNYNGTSVSSGTFGTNFWIEASFATGFSGFGAGAAGAPPAGSGTLPIDLIDFEVYCNKNDKELVWSTASEINNHYFLIERSIDAKSFEAIGKVDGSGNSNELKEYSYRDNTYESENKEKVYYRLKQIDSDGEYSYSPIISVQCLKGNIADLNDFVLSAYPNPVQDILHLTAENVSSKYLSVKVYNTYGDVIFERQNLNSGELNQYFYEKIDCSKFASGVYLLSVTCDKSTQTLRIIK